MNKEKKFNSELLIAFIYTSTLVNLFLIIFPTSIVSTTRYLTYIFIFLVCVIYNNFKFSIKYIIFQLAIFIALGLNLLLTSNELFVLGDVFSFILISLVPFYLISTKNLKYKDMLNKWLWFSKVITLFFPLFLILYNLNIIGYWVIGDLTTLNLMPLLIFIIFYKEFNILNLASFAVNFLIGLVLGSRSSIVALVITGLLLSIFVKKDSQLKYIAKIIVSGILIWLLLSNINLLLTGIRNITVNLGIHSRNIELFILQLEDFDLDVILSGRNEIYPEVVAFIKNNKGLPGGLGITRIITNGAFYHSHNVILDIFSIFGIVPSILILVWYIFKVVLISAVESKFPDKVVFCFAFIFYFWSSGMVNAYFLNDIFFLISFAILLFDNKQSFFSKVYTDFEQEEIKINYKITMLKNN